MLEIGTKAPAFTLPDQNGEMRSLADYQGQKVIPAKQMRVNTDTFASSTLAYNYMFLETVGELWRVVGE